MRRVPPPIALSRGVVPNLCKVHRYTLRIAQWYDRPRPDCATSPHWSGLLHYRAAVLHECAFVVSGRRWHYCALTRSPRGHHARIVACCMGRHSSGSLRRAAVSAPRRAAPQRQLSDATQRQRHAPLA
jgi:hypothetical protein